MAMKEENKLVKDIITGNSVPKSMGLIELEKNYAILADMLVRIMERVQRMENEIEKLEKKVFEISGEHEDRRKK